MDKLHPAKSILSLSLYTYIGWPEIRRVEKRNQGGIGGGIVSWKNEFESVFGEIKIGLVPCNYVVKMCK